MPDTDTPRQRARARTLEDITRIGRRHLDTGGAAALSVRAVARDLGVVSSAIYRYVRSRDDLLTLLVVDGYDRLGDAVSAAEGEVESVDHRGRFLAIGHAVRTWALQEPATYALLFGSPVPGYEAPPDRTTAPGTRVIGALVRVWEDAYVAGAIELPFEGDLHPAPKTLSADLGRIRAAFDTTAPDDLMLRGVLSWASLFGCISFEVFGQFGPGTFTAADELFEHQLQVLADLTGLAFAT